jgi:hypothetical protein
MRCEQPTGSGEHDRSSPPAHGLLQSIRVLQWYASTLPLRELLFRRHDVRDMQSRVAARQALAVHWLLAER